MKRLLCSFLLAVSLAATGVGRAQQNTQSKTVIRSQADLPHFFFPLKVPASKMLTADDATFGPFMHKVEADVNAVLAKYDIQDKSTLRQLLGARANVELLEGDWKAAQATTERIRGLQQKAAARLTTGLVSGALMKAAEQTGATSGPKFEKAFQKALRQKLDALPWATTRDTIMGARMSFEILSPSLLAGNAQSNLDPEVAKTGGLNLRGAEGLLNLRVAAKLELPLARSALAVLNPYIAAHRVKKPNIWKARAVTLTSADKLTPVRIAIFDSGVDTSVYPKQLFVDPRPGRHSPHGLAFNMKGKLVDQTLQPLSEKQKAEYPKIVQVFQGLDDLQNGIASPAAANARKMLSSLPADKMASFMKQVDFFGQYMHGTHVAGIAVRGNPAARLVVIEFYDSLAEIPFPPTVRWAKKFAADFHHVGVYLRKHNVRVVNMSWGDNQAEFEQWINKTVKNKTPKQRKELAAKIYGIWKSGIQSAIEAAPKTLWICAAGNSDINASFSGDVPAALQLPNLIAVGAVDQAGQETSFTSYGKTVVLYADGYQVPSYVPGGTRLRLSGTSMASPNVVNLAAKLIALDPSLTPEETIALMKKGATASDHGKLQLIDPRATVALLKQQMAGVGAGND